MPKPEYRIREIVAHFDYLAMRWEDEQQHEDFRDYKEAMRKFLEPRAAQLVEMTAQPLMLVFIFQRLRHEVSFEGDKIVLKVRNVVH